MIKILSQNLINQIAAGEVIERPSSVIKELIENSIDAGATEIQIKISDAGKSLISVSDNGCGMDKDSLQLCVLSHATSKLPEDNLFDIHTFGFRGEALPSMAAIARLSITSAHTDSNEAWQLTMENKSEFNLQPTTRKKGTTIEVRDLFFATPARLKFLKSDATESEACLHIFNKMALAFPNISFKFQDGEKKPIYYPATPDLSQRITHILGNTFVENIFPINCKNDKFTLKGFLSVPTFNKATQVHQYFFVNNRFVKDKVFFSALKIAYSGVVPQGRFPVAVVFFSLPYNEVDVNAHPAKTEIRFKNTNEVRDFLVSKLKTAIELKGSIKPTTELVNNFCQKISKTENPTNKTYSNQNLSHNSTYHSVNNNYHRENFKNFGAAIYQPHKNFSLKETEKPIENNYQSGLNLNFESINQSPLNLMESISEQTSSDKIDLGQPLYQIANTYIISATQDNLIIIDQHAAAERITLEKLNKYSKLESQDLLLQEMCPLTSSQIELLDKNKELLDKFGVVYEKFTQDMIIVRSLPSILGTCEVKPLISDIVEELEAIGNAQSLQEKIHLMLSTISCHGSLRAGKKLTLEEMQVLIKQMENTSNIAQCCHGRPSYIIINTKILNKFFKRS